MGASVPIVAQALSVFMSWLDFNILTFTPEVLNSGFPACVRAVVPEHHSGGLAVAESTPVPWSWRWPSQ